VIALASCEDGVYLVEIGATADEDRLAGREPPGTFPPRERPEELVPAWAVALLVDLDVSGSTVVLALDRRPPLLVSYDLGSSWSERGGGLPRGRSVALGKNPDHVLYAARNRLYLSLDGCRFWRSLGVDLPEVRAVGWG